jgi:hypothetical protein
MSRSVVISQSMYFPWVGLLEQIRLADSFVHYDDVQFDRGFYNRVQVKTQQGMRWITVPLSNHRRVQKISEIAVDSGADWRRQHRDILAQAYRKAPFLGDMLAVVDSVFERPINKLADVARTSLMALAEYFDLSSGRDFLDSRDLAVEGSSSQRLRDIVLAIGGETYITGHGAKNYLDHDMFERAGISVKYMDYRCTPYPQLHGPFTPYVSSLDLIANCGKQGAAFIASQATDWRKFLNVSD